MLWHLALDESSRDFIGAQGGINPLASVLAGGAEKTGEVPHARSERKEPLRGSDRRHGAIDESSMTREEPLGELLCAVNDG